MPTLTDFWRPLSSQVEDCPGTCRLTPSCQPNAVELCPGPVPREAVALVLCHSAPCCSLPLSSARPFNAKGLLVNRLWCIGMCSAVPVQLFATPWTVARQAPLSMEFSRQEYWHG